MNKKIAITGGIGSGKSAVLNIIKEKGYPVYSCDEIYKELITAELYVKEIEKVFPNVVNEGKIDRKRLAEIIFSNEQARTRLNEISHPLIMKTLMERMNETASQLVFAEVPLLFEGNFENLFDKTIVVLRNREERIRSICVRDAISQKEANERMHSQFNYDDLSSQNRIKKIGAILIENKGDVISLKKNVERVLKDLL